MWYNYSIFYQISTLDFCGVRSSHVKADNNSPPAPIHKIIQWSEYLKDMGFNALYLCPIFESDSHGYETRDYRKLDPRLGSNEDFARVVETLHENDIKVVIDGVFNHVGRGFPPFENLRQNKEKSRYKDWFFIDFHRDSPDRDGFYYEGWEGHYDLVKLNVDHPDVEAYLLESVKMWIDEFNIDGIRLDVAYAVSPNFLMTLRNFCKKQKEDFFLVGESPRDDYPFLLERMDSVTNYQAYKGIWSSLNSLNLYEIASTYRRQFNEMLPGSHLFSFLDNHDVTRIASMIENPQHLYLAYGLLMAMPGIPCIYYGSEWGEEGVKEKGVSDDNLRPYFEKPMGNDLTLAVKHLIWLRRGHPAFADGDYREVFLTNRQLIFERDSDKQRLIVALNIDDGEAVLDVNYSGASAVELISSQKMDFGEKIVLPPYSIQYWLMED